MQLAPGGHVDGQPLLGHHAVGGRDRKRLGRVDHLEVVRAGLERRHVGPCAGAHVVLRVHVRGRAVPLGQLDDVTPRDLEVAALVDPGAERVRVA